MVTFSKFTALQGFHFIASLVHNGQDPSLEEKELSNAYFKPRAVHYAMQPGNFLAKGYVTPKVM